ncbi:hypothetical protein QJS10_CPB13g00790 [Acorus calamus]|uniref:Uncharacterized protein n=1 Tax=Acorus calamus TaxID=4465 RepID=A0AAV9DGD2_ACOCL|nr:hypothetical protein QJS10_CPB13g00790 [Acorus calamus]
MVLMMHVMLEVDYYTKKKKKQPPLSPPRDQRFGRLEERAHSRAKEGPELPFS